MIIREKILLGIENFYTFVRNLIDKDSNMKKLSEFYKNKAVTEASANSMSKRESICFQEITSFGNFSISLHQLNTNL